MSYLVNYSVNEIVKGNEVKVYGMQLVNCKYNGIESTIESIEGTKSIEILDTLRIR